MSACVNDPNQNSSLLRSASCCLKPQWNMELVAVNLLLPGFCLCYLLARYQHMIWLILKHCWSHLWCHEQYSEGIESINPPSGTNESILFFMIQGPKYGKAQQLSVFPSTHYASPHGRRDFQALIMYSKTDCPMESQVTLLIPENPTSWDKQYLWTATGFERSKTVC